MHPALHVVPWALLVAGLGLASILDVKARKVPNWLSVSLLVGGIVARGLATGALSQRVGVSWEPWLGS